MKNKKIFIWSDTYRYLIFIGILVMIIAFYQPIIAIIAAIISLYLVYYAIRSNYEKNKEFTQYIEELTDEFDSAAKHAIFNMPFPLVLIDELGSIKWYNTPFLDLLVEKEILNERLHELIPDLELEDILERDEDNPIDISYGDKFYKIYPNFVETKKNNTKVPP